VKTATPAERAFWDSSGVVLLCANQRSTAAARRIRAQTGPTAIWWGTTLEVQSALQRLHRERMLSTVELAASLRRVTAISEASLEIAPSEAVRAGAAVVLDRHDLRAADALQLAAALTLCREHPRGRVFVCFDAKLAGAADAAGFTVLPSR
jgi:predicted nucleic acid-binding protein